MNRLHWENIRICSVLQPSRTLVVMFQISTSGSETWPRHRFVYRDRKLYVGHVLIPFLQFLIVCSYFIWGFLNTMNNWKNCGGVGTAIAFVTHLCQRKKTGDNGKNYVSLVAKSVFIFKCLHLHSKAGQWSNFSCAKRDFLMKSRSLTGTFVHPPNRTWPGDDRWKS